MRVVRSWLLFLVCGAGGAAGHAAVPCDTLGKLELPDARVTLTQDVKPNPEWKLPPSVFTGRDAVPTWPLSTRVAFCRVGVTIGKENRTEVWMPHQWNGRFMGVGNAGLTGGIHYPAMAEALAAGFATASTDTGHQTDNFYDTGWITGFPERVVDFGHRGHHAMAIVAKKVVAAYYQAPAKKSYFDGCSTGGWQGLTEAQKYPGDYDGILAGAPATNFVKSQARQIMLQQISAKEPRGDLSAELGAVIVKAALTRCDAQDGVTDGIINDPLACNFDPAAIQCKAGKQKDCLAPEEVKRAKWIYGPSKTARGLTLYPGPAPGAPPSMPLPGVDPRHPGDSALYLIVQEGPTWSVQTFDPDRDIPGLEARFGNDLNATNPDLSAFAARGGKLIMYHGWTDPLTSPYNTLDYFDAVSAKLGAGRAASFMRLYLAPGMAHCSGGTGPNEFNAVDVLVAWVEEGKAPTHLIATQSAGGKVTRSRPICPHPQIVRYKGTGNPDDAANFVCDVPKEIRK
jgi:feruloyl esterase